MELLLEIGTEEIPYSFIIKALDDLNSIAGKKLSSYRLSFKEVNTFGTPRRLSLCVKGLTDRQDDEFVKTLGPPKKVAFDSAGNPTGAAIGFARKQGVDVEELKVEKTDKGEYLCVEKETKGKNTKDVMPQILHEIMATLTFPKSMRWGDYDISFARPIHWILALLDGGVVPFSYGSIKSGLYTRGHPFLSNIPIKVNSLSDYRQGLKDSYVIVDPEKREEIIRRDIEKASSEVGGKVLEDDALLREVTYLVEYPVVLRGSFPEKFLALPKEALVHTMRSHQRYFSITDDSGKLMPYFITVANTSGRDPKTIIGGNERVIRARLEDARFFFEEDRKVPLEKRVEGLKEVVFQAKLGTSYEKVKRFRTLARTMASNLCPEKADAVDRVAYLCKGDLLTEMVGEFPALQGIIGSEYARLEGEPPEVAKGILEHYMPRNADDCLPEGIIGTIVSIADKLDTINGCFSVGLIPTGAADPYALRRQAIGIINMIIGKGLDVSLDKLIDEGLELLKDKWTKDKEAIKNEIKEFFRLRLYNRLTSSGLSHDVVEAVLSSDWTQIADAVKRIDALESFKGSPNYRPLGLTIKRVMNISKDGDTERLSPDLFHDEAEKALYDFHMDSKKTINGLLEDGLYTDALTQMTKYIKPVDRFFDKVMVMVEDKGLRDNRLSLLSHINSLFLRICDFKKLVVE